MPFPLYLDTADRDAWQAWLPTGTFEGITTNPLLLQRAGRDQTTRSVSAMIREVSEIQGGADPLMVQVQTWGTTAAEMVERALHWCEIGRPIIKVPATKTGFTAAVQLTARSIPVTITAVYSAAQIVPALAVGARFIAPYIGRLAEQQSEDVALDLVTTMTRAIAGSNADTQILLASIRTPDQLSRMVASGATAATVSPQLAEALFYNPATLRAVEEFDASVAAGRMA